LAQVKGCYFIITQIFEEDAAGLGVLRPIFKRTVARKLIFWKYLAHKKYEGVIRYGTYSSY
jgi:hypothetical protein